VEQQTWKDTGNLAEQSWGYGTGFRESGCEHWAEMERHSNITDMMF
jgi:hypothetical protein